MPGDCLATIVHISDLHFHHPLQTSAKKTVTHLDRRIYPHWPPRVKALSWAIEELDQQHHIDALVVTGDLTTLGDLSAFELVRLFIVDKALEIGKDTLGLNMKGRFFVVPGNHDVWPQKGWFLKKIGRLVSDPEAYKKCFREFADFPYVKCRKFGGRDFIFMGLDSNDIEQPNTYKVSQGQVSEAQLTNLVNELRNIKKDSTNGECKDVNYSEAFKIVLLHHHLTTPAWDDRPPDQLTKMLYPDKVLKLIQSEQVDLVLFGHTHRYYKDQYPRHGTGKKVLLCCAGTPTQLKQEFLGFNVYHFHNDSIYVQPWIHNHDKLRFEPFALYQTEHRYPYIT